MQAMGGPSRPRAFDGIFRPTSELPQGNFKRSPSVGRPRNSAIFRKGPFMFARRLASIGAVVAMCLFPALATSAADPYNIDVRAPDHRNVRVRRTTHQRELTVLEGIVTSRAHQRPARALRLSRRHEQPRDLAADPQPDPGEASAVVLGSSLGALCQATTPLYLNNGR